MIRLPRSSLAFGPQDIELDTSRQDFTIDIVEHLGGVSHLHLSTLTQEKLVIETKLAAAETTKTGISLPADKVLLFDSQTQARIR